ncbi:2-amino-3-carboxymuconate-6-semialdehyde decarboxylase [Myxococcus stipitatus DSM 14675]|uniref:2-amino-3-carboxymuconate-6-semialdehyde decarboxylase n=1 Tax=Myxococcus stipitatus (strain DSM 14675 / JCM 12634 / Mx s8) TaxID=1278073 RepID=L7UBV2_MYXSD|nr:amidohydrolase family protein [Myxococcus stipitatus]AGC45067.1 2-amino-3-carboxymuconate-6-semialdehyde decarboxylase [Myxococcus stipitatus DSM 14675]
MNTPLPKIALEEAYLHPSDVARVLGDEAALARLSDGGGVTTEYYRPILHRLGDFDEARLHSMDEAGIAHAILSLTAPGIQRIVDPREAAAQARLENDFLAGRIAEHPERYSGFAAVALHSGAEASAETRRAVTDLGFKGVLINGYTNTPDPNVGIYLDDPSLYGFWETLCELDVPVYLHPRPSLPGGFAPYSSYPEMKGATWGFGMETASHTVRLLLGGHFDRFPSCKLILGHMGEGLPALLWRTQNMFNLNPFDKRLKKTLPEYFADNIWITTSGTFSDSALTNAILTVGADHIMFSVDYPYSETAPAAAWIDRAPISELDRRKITHGNARDLFQLPLQPASYSGAVPAQPEAQLS